MLILCDGCNSKIRVPESAAGKRVKCPKCATMIRVPEAESAAPHEEAVSSAPLPPAPDDIPAPPEEEVDSEAFSTTPSSRGAKPPASRSSRAGDYDDDDEDDDDRDREDEDDDELDVSRRGGGIRRRPVSGMATASMVLGIVSVAFGVPGCTACCCGFFTAIAGITGILAIVFGYMGKSPGAETYTTTGIICGSCGVGMALIGIIWVIAQVVFRVGIGMGNF